MISEDTLLLFVKVTDPFFELKDEQLLSVTRFRASSTLMQLRQESHRSFDARRPTYPIAKSPPYTTLL
jgi:hypothetical protein